jgi:hypothetical protein
LLASRRSGWDLQRRVPVPRILMTSSTPSPPRPAFARTMSVLARTRTAALASVLTLVAVACTVADDTPAATVDAGDAAVGVRGAAGADPDLLPLPTLPSVSERHPERFDRSGCALEPDGRDCQAGAAGIDAAQVGDTDDDWRHLRGFSGMGWTTRATDEVSLLDGSLRIAPTGAWRATGLVRNGQRHPVAAPTVTATLFDAHDEALDTVHATVSLAVLRPGEPAPFELRSDVDAATVVSVRWSIDEPGAAGDDHEDGADPTTADPTTVDRLRTDRAFAAATALPARDLELSVLWQRFPDDPRPADLYLHRDPPDGPRPLVVFGQAVAVGPGTVTGTRVLGAWIDEGGRVLAVAEATVARPVGVDLDALAGVDPAGTDWAPPDLAPGEAADVVLVFDAEGLPAGIADARLVLWGTGA